LTGIIRTDEPISIQEIDLEALPRWQTFGWTLVAIDPEDERMADLYDTRHAEVSRWRRR
jgi:hypothetical protein